MNPTRGHRPAWVLLLLLCGLGASWAGSSSGAEAEAQTAPPVAEDLEAVPPAPLDGLEEAVRIQLQETRRQVERLVAERAEPSRLVPAFGDLGRLYLLYDRPETAAVCFRNVLRLIPGEPKASYYLGVIHQEAGRFEEALGAFDRVLAARPDDLPSLLRGGEILYQLRRLDDARQRFERARELAPKNAAVSFGLGRVANAEKRWSEAVEWFERTLAAQPEADSVRHPLGLAYRRLGRLQEAKDSLKAAGANAPIFDDPLMRRLFELTATSRSFFIEGNRARRRGLPELAESHYRRALELDPENASVRYNLGTLLADAGRVDEAEEQFRLATTHDPEHRDAFFNLGVGLRARGELGQAADAFRAVTRLDPDDSAARMELGATLYAAGQTEEGLELWRQITRLDVGDSELWLKLAQYWLQARRPADAEKLLDRAWTQSDDGNQRSEILLLRGDIALGQGRAAEAMAHLRDALELNPSQAEAAARLGDLLCARGDEAEARDVLDRALAPSEAYSPKLRPAAEALARLLATSADPDVFYWPTALSLAEAIFRRRQGPMAAETLAMALAAQGRFNDALAWQERLVQEVADTAPPAVSRRLRDNLARYRQGLRALPTCAALSP